MKLHTPDGSELMDVTSVAPHPEGLLIEGQIMGALPMKAVLRPAELRRGLRFLRPGLVLALVAMLFKR
ncbi:MAG: hypothetical protein EXR27_19335 [Betaproteobacteria bacterium]|nr:hypothetical protein [Betaproteobacteria bacterium]